MDATLIDTIAALKSAIGEAEQQLRMQRGELARLLLERGEPESTLSLQQQVAQQRNFIDQLREQLAGLEAPSTAKVEADVSIPKSIKGVVPHLPMFTAEYTAKEKENTYSDIAALMRKFKQLLTTHALPIEAHWERLLPNCFEDHYFGWFEDKLIGKGMTWNEAEEACKLHFSLPLRRKRVLALMFEMNIKNGESMTLYADRFLKAMRNAELADCEMAAEYFLYGLPAKTQDAVQSQRQQAGKLRFSNAKEATEFVVAAGIQVSEYDLTRSERLKAANSKNTCVIHGDDQNHSSAECRDIKYLKQQVQNSNSGYKRQRQQDSRTATMGSNKPAVICHNCGIPGHKANVCRKPKNPQVRMVKPSAYTPAKTVPFTLAQSPQFNASGLSSPLIDGDPMFGTPLDLNGSGKPTDTSVFMVKPNEAVPNAIVLPIALQGEQVFALLDTGSTVSVLDASLIRKLQLVMLPVLGSIKLASQDVKVPRIGIAQNVHLQYQQKSIRHNFEVMHLPEGYNVIIGMDLLSVIGLSVQGLATNFPGKEITMQAPTPVDSAANKLEPNASPVGSLEQRKEFFKVVQPAIDRNERIRKGAFCTMPEAEVKLPTPPNVQIWRRQYPIPMHSGP